MISGTDYKYYQKQGGDVTCQKAGEKPSDDYDCTQRGWYGMAKDSEKMLMSEAYIDATTGSMVVTIARKIVMKNGRTGVFATDVFLDSIDTIISQCTPGGSGKAMLLDGLMILASQIEGYTGTDVSEHGSDVFLSAIASEVASGTQEVTATVDAAADGARNVADESHNVDESAVSVADSAEKIGGFVEGFVLD